MIHNICYVEGCKCCLYMGWTPSCQPALGSGLSHHKVTHFGETGRERMRSKTIRVFIIVVLVLNSLFTVCNLVSCWCLSNWNPPLRSLNRALQLQHPRSVVGAPCTVLCSMGDKSLHGCHTCPAAPCLTQHILSSCPAQLTL